ncbi:MAG: hypothetical protein SFW67_35320 [Myxococcaceae bacterium]|nr:hypothetical protein [Myxococcaceae bacterium]
MGAQHLLSTTLSETWAIEPRDGVAAPLALEFISAPLAPVVLDSLGRWLEGYARRGPPWQDVIDADLQRDNASLTAVIERFVGVTLSDVVRNLAEERWVLPPAAWLRLTLDVFDAFERHGATVLAEPLGPRGIGWTLDGRLVLAPLCLNAVLAWSDDVRDTFILGAPEHVSPTAGLDERTLVFQLGVATTWLLTGWHPLEAEAQGHVGGLLRGERPLAAGWKLAASPTLVTVLERALSHDPAHRFQGLAPFRAALLDAVAPTLPLSRAATIGVLQAVTHRLVDRLVNDLWTHDALLPSTWEGLWPAGVHPLEGLSVLEDRLLEHRVDKRSLLRRAEVGHSLRPWRTPPERAEDEAHFRRGEARRWWRRLD